MEIMCKERSFDDIRLLESRAPFFGALHHGLKANLFPGSFQHSNPRWRLVSGILEFHKEFFTQVRGLSQAGKYSEIICRSAWSSQEILFL